MDSADCVMSSAIWPQASEVVGGPHCRCRDSRVSARDGQVRAYKLRLLVIETDPGGRKGLTATVESLLDDAKVRHSRDAVEGSGRRGLGKGGASGLAVKGGYAPSPENQNPSIVRMRSNRWHPTGRARGPFWQELHRRPGRQFRRSVVDQVR